MAPVRVTGVIKRTLTDKGYMFIKPDGPSASNPKPEDVFLHRSNADPDVFDGLEVGEHVSYLEQVSSRGLRALDVQIVG